MEPFRLGPYVVTRRIGGGGMGTVYEARKPPTGERVALKCLHPGRGASERGLSRFRREVEALRRVQHPVVVQVLDADLTGATPYLVMPFVEGLSLCDVIQGLREGDRKVRDFLARLADFEGTGSEELTHRAEPWVRFVIGIGARVAQALAAAHAQGLVHRDLKPANVMVGREGDVFLLDFGLVRDESAVTMTLSDERLGTPLYMSPEQVDRAQSVDHRCDLYSLGMTLFEALTLEPPLDRGDLPGLYRAILEEDPPSSERLNVAVPKDLARVIGTCVQKDVRDRYQDAGSLARDLVRLLGDRAPAPPKPGFSRRVKRAWRRGPLRRVAVAAVLLVAAGGGAWVAAAGTGRSLARSGGELDLSPAVALQASGDYAAAADLMALSLAQDPQNAGATRALQELARAVQERAVCLEETFAYARAAADLRLLSRLAPELGTVTRAEVLEGPAWRELEHRAAILLDPAQPEVDRLRALNDLGDREGAGPTILSTLGTVSVP